MINDQLLFIWWSSGLHHLQHQEIVKKSCPSTYNNMKTVLFERKHVTDVFLNSKEAIECTPICIISDFH